MTQQSDVLSGLGIGYLVAKLPSCLQLESIELRGILFEGCICGLLCQREHLNSLGPSKLRSFDTTECVYQNIMTWLSPSLSEDRTEGRNCGRNCSLALKHKTTKKGNIFQNEVVGGCFASSHPGCALQIPVHLPIEPGDSVRCCGISLYIIVQLHHDPA